MHQFTTWTDQIAPLRQSQCEKKTLINPTIPLCCLYQGNHGNTQGRCGQAVVWEAYYISRSSSPLPGDPLHLQSQPQRQTIKPKIYIFADHICTWSRKLSATILGRHGVWNLTLLLYDSPASNRIFQSLLLKFVLMRFQKMSAPCDKDRAWRSCGTANEASWQNSDFSIDHRLKTEETQAQMTLKELAQLKAVNKWIHEFSVFSAWGGVFSGHTKGWASSPGCMPETVGDPYGRGINTLREDTGSSGSSACWTKYQAPQTLTFPENAEDMCDSQCNICTQINRKKHFWMPLVFVLICSYSDQAPAEWCIWASKTQGAAGRRTSYQSYSSLLERKRKNNWTFNFACTVAKNEEIAHPVLFTKSIIYRAFLHIHNISLGFWLFVRFTQEWYQTVKLLKCISSSQKSQASTSLDIHQVQNVQLTLKGWLVFIWQVLLI